MSKLPLTRAGLWLSVPMIGHVRDRYHHQHQGHEDHRQCPHSSSSRVSPPRGRDPVPPAEALWGKIPTGYQEQATFYTDCYEAYKGVIPSAQHRAITKLARKTNHVERFNCTLRQRVSRLVRATLSFSKKLANHIGAIKYFICDYNLTKGAASVCQLALGSSAFLMIK